MRFRLVVIGLCGLVLVTQQVIELQKWGGWLCLGTYLLVRLVLHRE